MEICGFERTSRFETSRQSRQNRQRRKSTCHPKSMCMRKNYPEAMPMPPRCWLWSPRFTATWMRCRSLSRDCQQCGLWSSQDCWWILRSSQDCVKAFQALRLWVLTCSLWCCQTEKLKKSLDSKEAREIFPIWFVGAESPALCHFHHVRPSLCLLRLAMCHGKSLDHIRVYIYIDTHIY